MKENGYNFKQDVDSYDELREKIWNLYYEDEDNKDAFFDYFLSLDESVQNEWGVINTFFEYMDSCNAWLFLEHLEYKDFDFQKNPKVLEAAMVCCENGYILERAEYLSEDNYYGYEDEDEENDEDEYEKWESEFDDMNNSEGDSYDYDYLQELSYSDDNSLYIKYVFDIVVKNNSELAKKWAIRVSEIYEPYQSLEYLKAVINLDADNVKDYISDRFIDKALTQISPLYMPDLIELIGKADPQIAKEYFNEINLKLAFDRCEDFEIPNFVKALGEIDSDIGTTFVKDFMSYAFENCDKEKITNLVEELARIEYFCTCMETYERDYFDRDELKKYLKFALDNCPKKKIPDLFCGFNNMESVYSEEFIKDALINCPNENLSELMGRIIYVSGVDTVKNSINKIFEECKDDDIKLRNILKLFLKRELREEVEIPYKTTFVKELIKDHTEKIEIIDEACPEKIRKQPEINNLISKIKDANANYSNQEEDSKEIKLKQVENIKDDIFVK